MSLGRIAHRSLCRQAMKLITSPLRKAAQLRAEGSCCLNLCIHLGSPNVTQWGSFRMFRPAGQPGQGPDTVTAGVKGLGCRRARSPIESDDADPLSRLDSSMGALVSRPHLIQMRLIIRVSVRISRVVQSVYFSPNSMKLVQLEVQGIGEH